MKIMIMIMNRNVMKRDTEMICVVIIVLEPWSWLLDQEALRSHLVARLSMATVCYPNMLLSCKSKCVAVLWF